MIQRMTHVRISVRDEARPSPQVLDDLRELIVALDRRVPQLERAGEIDIARDAAALRDEALRKIAVLESELKPEGAASPGAAA